MIEVRIFHTKQGISAFSLSGHSGYAEAGSDIVCAAASAISQYVIEVFRTMQFPCTAQEQDGLISLALGAELSEVQRAKAQELLLPFESVMKELCEQYGSYIKICSMEV